MQVLSWCVATSTYGYDGLGLCLASFHSRGNRPHRALHRLGSDATNKRFPCVKFRRMRGFFPLRYGNRSVMRRSFSRPHIQLHLMQGEGDFPRISFRRIQRQLGLLTSSPAECDGRRLPSHQVPFDATEGLRPLHRVLPGATQTLYPLPKSHLMRRTADGSGINLWPTQAADRFPCINSQITQRSIARPRIAPNLTQYRRRLPRIKPSGCNGRSFPLQRVRLAAKDPSAVSHQIKLDATNSQLRLHRSLNDAIGQACALLHAAPVATAFQWSLHQLQSDARNCKFQILFSMNTGLPNGIKPS